MTREKKTETSSKRRIDLSKTILCACNGLECDGTCKEEHLRNDRTGICVAAYNPTLNRDRRVSTKKDELEEYRGVFG